MRFIIQIIKGALRDKSSRRTGMFVIVIAALVLLFAGVTFLSGWLLENPMTFLVYWAICAWLTLTTMLLAFYDLLATRSAAQRESRDLAREALENVEKHHKS